MILRFQQSYSTMSERKKEADSQTLRILSLETLNTLYSEGKWLYVFTDGSKLTDNINVGAGVSSAIYSPSMHQYTALILMLRLLVYALLYLNFFVTR
ncbi:hypothetical protein TNIN_327231 [Trichonephila inaurata madagascariensis]|uniref:Uncharacterized protein n=1 Tax=Trichonephila inaurata madagascariensis TaxID=2747483 RepID=A0A8X6IEA7_9ARAC|nr:hypothetical protein TNIN_327231 [Trichonephila inaurata madagascariensis]